jgi:hypothetical protein
MLPLRNVAQEAKIQLEMLYVGKSNPRDKVRKNNTTIIAVGIFAAVARRLHIICAILVSILCARAVLRMLII